MRHARAPIAAAVVTTTLLAAQAEATRFSFAANDQDGIIEDHFSGLGADINSIRVPITLRIEDENESGGLPPASLDTRFYSNFTITYLGSEDFTSTLGYFQHSYSVTGGFSLIGQIPLTVEFSSALMTVRGGENSWFSTATIQGGDFGETDTVSYTVLDSAIQQLEAAGIDTAAYGIYAGVSVGLDDFGFALSSIQPEGTDGTSNAGITLDENFLPNARWEAQASFTGSAFFVPAPGAAAVLGMGGLLAARRRR